MAYAAPKSKASCVLSRHLDGKGMPLPMPPQLAAELHAGGVRRILLGHTPHGDCPTIIKNGEGTAQARRDPPRPLPCPACMAAMRATWHRGRCRLQL